VAVRVFGTPSDQVTHFVAPGIGVALAVNSLGVPYVANNKGQVYSNPAGGTWTLLTAAGSVSTDAKDVIFGPEDDLYIIGRLDSKLYKLNKSSTEWEV
jgi:hypothetical protein